MLSAVAVSGNRRPVPVSFLLTCPRANYSGLIPAQAQQHPRMRQAAAVNQFAEVFVFGDEHGRTRSRQLKHSVIRDAWRNFCDPIHDMAVVGP